MEIEIGVGVYYYSMEKGVGIIGRGIFSILFCCCVCLDFFGGYFYRVILNFIVGGF